MSEVRSNAYVGILGGVSNPRGEPANAAVGQLAEDILPACELRPPFDAKPLAIQRVKPVMNIDVLWTMGIMFLARAEQARVIWQPDSAWPRAGRKGAYDSPPPLLSSTS